MAGAIDGCLDKVSCKTVDIWSAKEQTVKELVC